MRLKRKFQVFVSSTYEDLKSERQAAVQAILSAKHIPAGMELFAAGDEEQMIVIKKWIDNSDVFLLILGDRYGSIEVKSGKSYTNLEFEYAFKSRRPLFAIVKKNISECSEKEKNSKYLEFKTAVTSSMMVEFWEDEKDIKLAIQKALSEFEDKDEIKGWIKEEEFLDFGLMAEELARLSKKNNQLQQELNKISNGPNFNGHTFNELLGLLGKEITTSVDVMRYVNKIPSDEMTKLSLLIGDEHISLLHLLWGMRNNLALNGASIKLVGHIQQLISYGIVLPDDAKSTRRYSLTEMGSKMIVHLQITLDGMKIE